MEKVLLWGQGFLLSLDLACLGGEAARLAKQATIEPGKRSGNPWHMYNNSNNGKGRWKHVLSLHALEETWGNPVLGQYFSDAAEAGADAVTESRKRKASG